MSNYVEVEQSEACDLLGEAVHTGLRKGTDEPSAHGIWAAINDSDDDAWSDALQFAVVGLESMGYVLVRKGEPDPWDEVRGEILDILRGLANQGHPHALTTWDHGTAITRLDQWRKRATGVLGVIDT